MAYDILVFLLCLEFSIIVGLLILLSKKRKIIAKQKREKPYYYSLKSSLDIYKEQLKSISDYNTELENLNKQKENQLSLRKKILQKKEELALKEKYADRIYDVEKNISWFNKCYNTISKTNNIDVLQAEYKSGLESIRWRINEESTLKEHFPLEYRTENLLNSFKEYFNEAIVRIAGFHLIKYKAKFHELYSTNARQTHTRRIFVMLDTLRELVEIDVTNSDFVLEKLNEYHTQVEDMFAGA